MTIFITGTNSGIGKALAEEYLTQNAKVYGLGKKAEPSIRDPRFEYISLDLEATETVAAGLQPLLTQIDGLDLVVLNAGVLGDIKEMRYTPLYEIESVMRVNVWANKVILDTLIELDIPVAQIVGISSGAAVNASKGWGSYSLSKSALNMLLKLYSREMASTHITALAPGVVDTPMVRHITDEVDGEKFPSAQRLKNGPILPPRQAARRLIEAFDKVKKYESGSFLDVRTMD